MAEFTPNKAGPQNIRELYYYVYKELQRLGGMLGDIDDLGGGGGGGGPETDPIFSVSPAATITQQDINDWNAGLSGGGGVKEEIESITLTTAGEFDFDSIPQGYKRLVIEGRVRSDAVGGSKGAALVMNDETTKTNYYRQNSAVNSGSSALTKNADNIIAITNGTDAPAGSYSAFRAIIEDYVGDKIKSAEGFFSVLYSTGQIYTGTIGLWHNSLTDPITRIRIRTDNHPTSGLVGTLTLYGEY